jgi:PilZ domain.
MKNPFSKMRCPQCDSTRIQRDYDNAFALAHLAGMRKLLCNRCGHVFQAFDPLSKLRRAPAKPESKPTRQSRSTRFTTHVPAAISLIYDSSTDGKATYSVASQGHCESISKTGMGLSLVGSKFAEKDLTQIGRLLFVRLQLPESTVEAVVAIVNSQRVGEDKKRKWHLGVKVHQISDEHKEQLTSYLARKKEGQPLVISE